MREYLYKRTLPNPTHPSLHCSCLYILDPRSVPSHLRSMMRNLFKLFFYFIPFFKSFEQIRGHIRAWLLHCLFLQHVRARGTQQYKVCNNHTIIKWFQYFLILGYASEIPIFIPFYAFFCCQISQQLKQPSLRFIVATLAMWLPGILIDGRTF